MGTPRIVFCRVGYMTYYAGPQPGDERPVGGGSYNKTSIGHEIWNFAPLGKQLFGYVQPYLRKNTNIPTHIDLSRIDSSCKNSSIDHVLVVFIAPHPDGGQVVVGWYSDATVHTTALEHKKGQGRDGYAYYMSAKANNCVLLPTNRRTLKIPSGKNKPGRANIYYFLDPKGNPKFEPNKVPSWLSTILAFTGQYKGPNLVTDADSELDEDIEILAENNSHSDGQGFKIDKQDRQLIDKYAMSRAQKYYGPRAINVSATQSYDFHMKMGSHECFIEVKGTQTAGKDIILTNNEVALLRRVYKNGHDTALFVVYGIRLKGRGKKRRASHGIIREIRPFDISTTHLTPISYKCALDDD